MRACQNQSPQRISRASSGSGDVLTHGSLGTERPRTFRTAPRAFGALPTATVTAGPGLSGNECFGSQGFFPQVGIDHHRLPSWWYDPGAVYVQWGKHLAGPLLEPTRRRAPRALC